MTVCGQGAWLSVGTESGCLWAGSVAVCGHREWLSVGLHLLCAGFVDWCPVAVVASVRRPRALEARQAGMRGRAWGGFGGRARARGAFLRGLTCVLALRPGGALRLTVPRNYDAAMHVQTRYSRFFFFNRTDPAACLPAHGAVIHI